tara:strand:+ start:708 stop:833 length:126 start_codon:yes stop_codon:yes gene_type:complete
MDVLLGYSDCKKEINTKEGIILAKYIFHLISREYSFFNLVL